jgi:hypothetical protein
MIINREVFTCDSHYYMASEHYTCVFASFEFQPYSVEHKIGNSSCIQMQDINRYIVQFDWICIFYLLKYTQSVMVGQVWGPYSGPQWTGLVLFYLPGLSLLLLSYLPSSDMASNGWKGIGI